jgi:mono/diheme cytochrome c family protein
LSVVRKRLVISLAALAAVAATVGPVLAAGNPTAGKAVYNANGCGGCHVFKAAGSKGKVGPALTKAGLTAHAKAAKQTLAVYVRAAIVKPDAYLVKGFPKGVMPGSYGTRIKTRQLDDLVAFVARG